MVHLPLPRKVMLEETDRTHLHWKSWEVRASVQFMVPLVITLRDSSLTVERVPSVKDARSGDTKPTFENSKGVNDATRPQR